MFHKPGESEAFLNMMDVCTDIYSYNEKQANHYFAACLRYASLIVVLMWLLNFAGFFIVERMCMNIVMPVALISFLIPSVLEKLGMNDKKSAKFVMISCFLFGIASLSAAITIHVVLAWACTVIISCHYYNPRLTLFTTIGALILMLVSLYVGLVIGVWDSNIMRSIQDPGNIRGRFDFVMSAVESGDDLLWRCFCFYYVPRATILIFIHLISMTLSVRTHRMLEKQDDMTRESERIRVELDVAKEIQSSMLPCIFPAFPHRNDFDIFASMVAAREVGGDFYDFFMADDSHLALVIGDVSGKGVPASLFMVITKTLIKDHVRIQKDVASVFNDVNAILCESNREDFFITAFLAVIDLETGFLSCVNAGHNPPFVLHDGQLASPQLRAALPLAAMEGTCYQSQRMRLEKGDVMFLYTDGVSEAEDEKGNFYTDARLKDVLQRSIGLDMDDLIKNVYQDVLVFRGDAEPFDDITMLAMKYCGTGCGKDDRENI